jgi:hypothetical protein
MKNNPTSSSFTSPGSSRETREPSSGGSEWNNKITRRLFLKRTGAATAATMIAWNLSSQSAHATEPAPGDSAKVWRRRRWGCKLAITGAQNGPFTEAQIDELEMNYEMEHHPWQNAPSDPPQGGRANDPDGNDPEVTDWWIEPGQVNTTRYREPENPQLQSWQNPADGKFYAVYLYDYIEEKYETTVMGP